MAAPLRFDRSARHGGALVGIAFAAYLTVASDFGTLVQAANYAGTIPNDVPLVEFVQFLTLLAVFLVSFALIATSPMRRAVTLTVMPLVLLGWAFLGIEQSSGVLPLGDATIWAVLLDQGFVTLLVTLGGWLIARGLHPLSWLVLLLALLPPLAGVPLVAAQVDAVTYSLVVQGVVLVAGVGGAALAFAIDRAVRRRRTPIAPTRLDPPTRYGIALGMVVAATYLNIATDFTGYLNQTHYGGSASVSVLGLLQFAMILVLYVVAFTVMPVGSGRRLAAVTFASVVLLLWATLGIERSVGNLAHPVQLWFVLLNQGFITLLVSLGGWLIVRGRHPLAFVVVALAIVPPLVARALDDASVTSGSYTLTLEGVIAVGGLVGGALAWAIDALARRIARRGESAPARAPRPAREPTPHARPAGVTVVAVIVWIDGVTQMLTGVFDLAGQGTSGEIQRIGALTAALVTIAIGLATVLVGVGLLQGRRAARIVVTVFIGLSLLGEGAAVVGAVVGGHLGELLVAAVVAALDVVAIVLLWSGRSGAFFSRGRTPTPAVSRAG
jgi:hypothetical protein